MNTSSQSSISVIGLGKLGSPLAAVLASSGYTVTGVDANPSLVKAISEGRAPTSEPGLQTLIDSCQSLNSTTNCHEAVVNSDITFLVLPTPSTDSGWFSNEYLLSALKEVGSAIKDKSSYHLVVITSTVMPGSMNSEIRETLEKHADKVLGEQLGLCYHPEFIALGNVIQNMLTPDTLLIGESDARAGDILEAVYAEVCKNEPSIQRMNFVNAELTKIAVNTFVTTKISYANMLSEVCDKLPGADADVVTTAVGSDSRIGSKYLKPALGYGGPCFPRDNKAFAALTRELNSSSDIAVATDKINDRQVTRLLSLITQVTPRGCTIAILGLAYKPETNVCEASQAVTLANKLNAQGYKTLCHDPLADRNDCSELSTEIDFSKDLESVVSSSTTIVITTPWKDYRELSKFTPNADQQHQTIVDPWRIINNSGLHHSITLITPGKG